MAATDTTPTEATTVDIGMAAIMAGAITGPAIIPTTRPSLWDCRFWFLSQSRSRNNGSGVRIQEDLTRGKFCNFELL